MTETHGTTLRRNAMGVPEMVFLVIAFAAPLAASTTNIPMAIGLGNGVGAPGTFLIVAVVLALFAVGYSAMSSHITNAGAFYAYITAGLGLACRHGVRTRRGPRFLQRADHLHRRAVRLLRQPDRRWAPSWAGTFPGWLFSASSGWPSRSGWATSASTSTSWTLGVIPRDRDPAC